MRRMRWRPLPPLATAEIIRMTHVICFTHSRDIRSQQEISFVIWGTIMRSVLTALAT